MMFSVRGWSCGKPSACNRTTSGRSIVVFNKGLNIACFLPLFNLLRKTALCASCYDLRAVSYFTFALKTCVVECKCFHAHKCSLCCFRKERIALVSWSGQRLGEVFSWSNCTITSNRGSNKQTSVILVLVYFQVLECVCATFLNLRNEVFPEFNSNYSVRIN